MPAHDTADDHAFSGWLDARQQRAWLAYIKVQLRLTYEMNRQLQTTSDLSLGDWDVLTALGASTSGALATTTLATQIGWERSRLSHHAKRMAGRGLLELRTSATDRRATELVLTPAGRATLEKAAPGHVELIKRLFFAEMPDELLEPLAAALESVYANLLKDGSLPAHS
jgi:DNA-binding MarR family transcriptional regulator